VARCETSLKRPASGGAVEDHPDRVLMAVITVPRSEPWVVARWAFRTLLERVRAELPGEADRYAIDEAIALDGLHLELQPSDQALRLANALTAVAGELRTELAQRPSDDERDQQLATYLARLEADVRRVYE
jgi:hypothetical protein